MHLCFAVFTLFVFLIVLFKHPQVNSQSRVLLLLTVLLPGSSNCNTFLHPSLSRASFTLLSILLPISLCCFLPLHPNFLFPALPVFSLHGPEFVPGYNGADYRRQSGTAPRPRRAPDASSWILQTRPTASSGRSNTEKSNCKQTAYTDWLRHTHPHITSTSALTKFYINT